MTFQELKIAVKKHLSIIGKRLFDRDGKNMFSNITLSSAEDPILDQYLQIAAQNLEAAVRQLVVNYELVEGSTIDMTLHNTRHATLSEVDFDERCRQMFMSYIVNFVVGEYLGMTHPELAEKYYRNNLGLMSTITAFVYFKGAPKGEGEWNPDVHVTQPIEIDPEFKGTIQIPYSDTSRSKVYTYTVDEDATDDLAAISTAPEKVRVEIGHEAKKIYLTTLDDDTQAVIYLSSALYPEWVNRSVKVKVAKDGEYCDERTGIWYYNGYGIVTGDDEGINYPLVTFDGTQIMLCGSNTHSKVYYGLNEGKNAIATYTVDNWEVVARRVRNSLNAKWPGLYTVGGAYDNMSITMNDVRGYISE